MAGVVVNPFVTIGGNVIVNTGSVIDHDCNISNSVHVSPRASLAGVLEVGRTSWPSTGAQVK